MPVKKVYLSGKVVLKSTFSQKAEPVDKAKVRARGPNLIGQLKNEVTVPLGHIRQDDFLKRWDAAVKILETGKIPAAVKETPKKVSDATLAKAKGDLTKAKNKIDELKKEINALKAAIPKANPVKE